MSAPLLFVTSGTLAGKKRPSGMLGLLGMISVTGNNIYASGHSTSISEGWCRSVIIGLMFVILFAH